MGGAIMLIGASTGAPRSHHHYLSGGGMRFPAPIVIVQHMPRGPFIQGLLRYLQRAQPRQVQLVQNGQRLQPGQVYLVEPGQHLRFTTRGRADVRPAAGESEFAPAMDVTFASAAAVWGAGVCAALVSGLHAEIDGLRGCAAVRARGGCVVASTRATTEVYSMIEQVAAAAQLDAAVALDQLLVAGRRWFERRRVA